jgi:hypothetical protein
MAATATASPEDFSPCRESLVRAEDLHHRLGENAHALSERVDIILFEKLADERR